jgi:16S rRNA (uracil1498-N3)-methyltransferase
MKDRPPRAPRVFVEQELRAGAKIGLPAAAAHHVARVLRLREGETVTLFDGRGGEYGAKVFMPGRGHVVAEVGEKRAIERESPLAVTLVQAVSAGEKMDYTIRKAVELGVAAIQPVFAEKSVVRLAGERAAKRLEHWQRVAIAACEQCGRNRVPLVREPLPLARYRPEAAATKLLLSPLAGKGLRELSKAPLILAVGPEAGFAEEEEAQLERAGFVPVRLGPRVLRTETAALAALAALNALHGDF